MTDNRTSKYCWGDFPAQLTPSRDAAIATCKRLRSTWFFPGVPRAMDNQRYKIQTTVSRVEALEFLIYVNTSNTQVDSI